MRKLSICVGKTAERNDLPLSLELLDYTASAILPVFFVIFIGVLLNKLGFFSQKTKDEIVKLVFYVGTPCLIFKNTSSADFHAIFDARFIGFTLALIAALIVLSIALCFFIKDPRKKASVVQTAYRSNFAIAGMPIAMNLMNEDGVALTAITLSFVVLFYNVTAVTLLSYYCGKSKSPKSVALGIVKNPLIIATFLGLIFSVFAIPLPKAVVSTVGYLGDIASSMGLLTIGATITLSGFKNDRGLILYSVFLRNVFAPLFILVTAYLFGVRGDNLLVLAVMSSTPAAVNCFAMSKQMGADAEISAYGVSLTSIASIVSVFLAVYLMKALGLA